LPVIKIQDRAHEFRLTVEGRLAGEGVKEVASLWAAALAEALPRKITVDISLLTGYDAAGRKLLRQMELHGTDLAASTPESLFLLADATTRRRGVTVMEPAVEPIRPGRETAPKQLLVKTATGT
jgi:hypothetical protein